MKQDDAVSRSGVYPWQRTQWDACVSRLDQNRLAHALLVHGEVGVGVGHFAAELVRALLCVGDGRGEGKPCGECRGCRLYAGGNHPDFRKVAAEKEDGEIKVGQIRDLLPFVQTSRHYGASKVVLICEAGRMNRSAANGLLKMLEEPPAGTVMVLSSHHPFRLPATVRSRCQTVRLHCTDEHEASAWVAAAAGVNEAEAQRRLIACNRRPLHAAVASEAGALGREDFRADLGGLLQGRAVVVEISEKWQAQPVAAVHQWLLEAAEETIRREFSGAGAGLSLRKLFRFYDRQKYRCLSAKVRLNPRLLLESALIEWQLVCAVK